MFSNNTIVSVFEKRPLTSKSGNEFGYSCRITSSRAVRDEAGNFVTDENGKRKYDTDFSGWVSFVGKAYAYMKEKEISDKPTRVRLENTAVSSNSTRNEDGTWNNHYRFLVFQASDPNFTNEDMAVKAKDSSGVETTTDSNDLPF